MKYIAPLISFLLCSGMLFFTLRSPIAKRFLDKPNHRSLHQTATPRIGGTAIFLSMAISWLFFSSIGGITWAAIILLVIISLADDMIGLSSMTRLAMHFIATCLFFASVNSGFLITPILIVICVWMINLYNFMDGSDGLAGGMGVFGFSAFGVAALLAGADDFAVVNFIVAGACAAFLIFNFHPAKVFMGDSGSILLGFLVVAFGLNGWQQDVWPYWFPVLVFSPFIVDASVTLGKRLRRKEKIWEAHKEHYYQKLVQMGWGHRKTALVEYALMLAVGVTAVLAVKSTIYVLILAFWAFIYLMLILAIEWHWEQFQAKNNQSS